MNCCSIGTRATSIFLYIMIKSKQTCILEKIELTIEEIYTFLGLISCNTSSRKHAKRNVYFLVEELEVLQHKRHGMVLLTNLQRSFLLCSSTWGYKGQKFTIWRPSRHQQRWRWPPVSCCQRGIGAGSTGKKVAGAPCPSDLSCEGSARRRGAGRRRRRSRDEEEQDGAEVVVADAPPSAGDPPLQCVMGGGRRSHGASP